MDGFDDNIFGSYNSLCRALTSDKVAFELALHLNLIKLYDICECGGSLNWITDKTQKFGVRWRCSKSRSVCGKAYSILCGTWFQSSRLDMRDQLLLIFCYCMDMKPKHLIGMFNFGCGTTASDWANYFRDICAIFLAEKTQKKIGGPGLIVEIDETKIRKRKNNIGRLSVDEETREWVFGGICRETKETFFCLVPNRKEATLIRLIQEIIVQGTKIISDCWASYAKIAEYGYTHAQINHSENFISPEDPAIHTQTIERVWKGLKETVPKGSRHASRITYILEYSFKRHMGWFDLKPADRFKLLIGLISRYY